MANIMTFDSGPLQARIDEDSGSVALAGPDPAGAPLANLITFEPPVVTIGGLQRTIGRVVSSTSLANGFQLIQDVGGTNVTAQLTFPADGVMRYDVVDWAGLKPDQTSVSASSDGNEHFYGFGEKFNALDQAGKVVDILTFDNPGDKGDRSYKVAPWFISTRGYGFYLESTARCTFDMRAAVMGRYTITNQIGTLKFNVVYGPALTDVLSRYTGLTGRPALPPPFAFGPWISSDIWRDGGEVNYAVTKFRQRGIPVSGFVFDSPWEVAYNDFRFNIGDPGTTQFGHPGTFEGTAYPGFTKLADMMTFLRENGLKAICWMTPFVDVSSTPDLISPGVPVPGQNLHEAQPAGKQDRFFVRKRPDGHPLVVPWWKGQGRPIDFTSKEARDWLSGVLNELLTACLVDTKSGKERAIGGFKTDDGESGNATNTYIPDAAVYSNGQTGREFVNGYCRAYLETVYNVLAEKGLIFARSGFAGTQAFPGCWAGDNQPNFGTEDGLPSVIVAGLSAAMSGYSIWGHDVGGYLDGPFSPVSPADLFMRWTQFGCFSPIMQMHRQVNKTHEFRQYPWGYPEAGETIDNNRALANYKFYATLHTRLFPYVYTYAQQSSQTGLPIIRPLVLLHPNDPKSIPVEDTYYFGGDLLVAPVIQPKASGRSVYLPEGNWLDFWTNERHAGLQDIAWTNPDQPAPPESKIPVFVRDGAIIPLILGEDTQTLCDANYVNNPAIKSWDGGLEIRVYPAGTSQFTIFDGTDIQSVESAGATSVSINSPTARSCLLRVLAARPAVVRRDGDALTEIASATAFEAAPEGWLFDAVFGFVLVKFLHAGGRTVITF